MAARARAASEASGNFPQLRVTGVTVSLDADRSGHDAGQIAFVAFDRREGEHPFTIASARESSMREITLITKAPGGCTDSLAQNPVPGGEVTVEEPYGCSTFDDVRERRIWIGGGIDITSITTRAKHLAKASEAKRVDLIHTMGELSPETLELLEADAVSAVRADEGRR